MRAYAVCDAACERILSGKYDVVIQLCIRDSIKVEPMRWYYHCDRLGMRVWQDMVSGGAYIGDFYAGAVSYTHLDVYKRQF